MASSDHAKPSPEELLRRIESQESEGLRGRLKIFLGYAPHVGKSRRMFDEGKRRKRRGQDVVVGSIQARGIEELADDLAVLEVVGSNGIDVDRMLKRRPQVCLVDELAMDNPPGSRNPKRWQDVLELLASGIHVITALNLQHIEEMQDAVEAITGKRAAHSVPRSFIASADEIEVVDVPEEELVKAAGGRSAETEQQLSRLREAALFLAAEVIEGQLERYMDRHGIRQAWGAQERILVCLTPRSDARAMIGSGRRNADRFHGQLLAVSVEQTGLSPQDREALDANLDLARKMGAETHVLQGTDPVETILRFAAEHRVTQIFVGHSRASRWMPWIQHPADRLIEAAEGMDVRIFPQSRAS
jgi:two-component system sensor histidine kinase KdpD